LRQAQANCLAAKMVYNYTMAEVVLCRCCDLAVQVDRLEPGTRAQCPRCGSKVTERKLNSLQRTTALTLAALVLYVPANIYPILRMEFYGAYSESTVWDGCVKLFQDGMWFIAIIVFLASILIPLFKLLGLFFLVLLAKTKSTRWQRERTRIYQFIDVIGPWAMLDVFLLAVLVAVVKLEQLATILPGPGIIAFASVVILTILASQSFDPRLIWDEPKSEESPG
jgi:paraquat-inducible protein A